MKHARLSVVLACAVGLVACSSLPTRQKVEAEEDAFCRAVSRARVLEVEYGLNPPDGGEAGAKP